MPRLIIHPLIVATILAAGLAGIALSVWQVDQGWLAGSIYRSLAVVGLVTLTALGLYLALDTKPVLNFIHIARDLIDHHYKPELSFAYRLLPRDWKGRKTYPRRERLLSRVESAVTHLEQQGCGAFVFVAHSQGTIIVFEYLTRPSGEELALRLPTAVVTFGSPLDHLYAHYFHRYADVGTQLEALRRRVSSWTNLYRIDDPIGNRIGGRKPWPSNLAMEKGGHTNYWQEQVVAQVICGALSAPPGKKS